MRTRWIPGALLVGAFAASAGPVTAQERFTLRGNQAAVYNLVGEVTVAAGRGSDVVVEVTRGGDDGPELRVRRKTVDGWSALVIEYPDDEIVYPRLSQRSRSTFNVDDDGTFGAGLLRLSLEEDGFSSTRSTNSRGDRRIRVTGRGNGLEAWADLRVLVPQGRTIALHLGVGRVNVSNVNGHVRVRAASGSVVAGGVSGSTWIETGSGGIRVDRLSGPASLRTGSGSIDANGLRGGRVDIETGSGSIDAGDVSATGLDIETGSGSVRLASVNAQALRVNTGSGGITVNGLTARDLELDTGSGSISGELLSDVRNASIETGSGGIALRLPESLGAEITIRTGSGGISTDVPIRFLEQRRSYVRGRVGDGNGTMVITTGSGSVRLRPM